MSRIQKSILANDILASYKRIQNKDAEPDLRNKFRALLYYHTKDGTISNETLKEVLSITQSEFICLLLARKDLVCYNGGNTDDSESESSGSEEEDIITCTSLQCKEQITNQKWATPNRRWATPEQSSPVAKTNVTNKKYNDNECVCSNYYFSDLLLDNDGAKIRSKDDLIKAIQSFSQNAISRYRFTSADVDLLPIAIEHYNALAIEKILPFAKSANNIVIKIPDISEFPRLQQEMSRFRRDTVWYQQLQQVQEENRQRLNYWRLRAR
jgi:hypothetical protein